MVHVALGIEGTKSIDLLGFFGSSQSRQGQDLSLTAGEQT